MGTTDHRPEDHGEHGLPLAEYVEGLLPPKRRHEVENHVRQCRACSAEVALARLGREAGRRERVALPSDDPSPGPFHERLMAGLPAEARTSRDEPVGRSGRRVGRRSLLVAAGVLVVAGAGAEALRRSLGTGEVGAERSVPASVPASGPGTGTGTATASATGKGAGVLETAVVDYRAGRLPSGGRPTGTPPDLRALGLTVRGAGTGALADQAVSAYEFRSGSGERVVVYVGDRPFSAPELQGSQFVPTPVQDLWATWFPRPAPTLVLGEDERLVHDVCEALV